MNKVSRLLGSATLASCLALGGGALAAGPASANDNGRNGDDRSHSRYDNDKDRKDREERDRHHRDSKRHDNDHKYLHVCFERSGKAYFAWVEKDDDRKRCYIVRPLVRKH